VRKEIDQLQLILNVNKIILLIVILIDSWHQNIASVLVKSRRKDNFAKTYDPLKNDRRPVIAKVKKKHRCYFL